MFQKFHNHQSLTSDRRISETITEVNVWVERRLSWNRRDAQEISMAMLVVTWGDVPNQGSFYTWRIIPVFLSG